MIQITAMKRAIVLALFLLWALSLFAVADLRDDFAQKTGLDRDLINLVTIDVGGTELTVTFVFINERTFQSKISPDLAWKLQPYLGQNAIYVNPSIDAVVSAFPFDPQLLSVEQNGIVIRPDPGSWRELTTGFLAGTFQVNPSGPERGSGSEGVLVLGDSMDSQQPFTLVYATKRAPLEIAASVAGSQTAGVSAAAIQSHDPIDVEPLETLGSLEGLLLHEEFSSDAMAAVFELDPGLVRTMVLSPRGHELRLFFVRLESSVSDSLLGPDLIEAIDEVIGTGAVMVWAVSPTDTDFSPWNFFIQQRDTNFVFFSAASFVELTDGFLRVERVEAGALAAGIIRLPLSVDADAPYAVFYGTSHIDYP